MFMWSTKNVCNKSKRILYNYTSTESEWVISSKFWSNIFPNVSRKTKFKKKNWKHEKKKIFDLKKTITCSKENQNYMELSTQKLIHVYL